MKHYLIANMLRRDIDDVLSGERWWYLALRFPRTLTFETAKWEEDGNIMLMQERGTGGKIRAVAHVASIKTGFYYNLEYIRAALLEKPEENYKRIEFFADMEKGSGMTLREIDDFFMNYKEAHNSAIIKLENVREVDMHACELGARKAIATYAIAYGRELTTLPSGGEDIVTLKGYTDRLSSTQAAISYGLALGYMQSHKKIKSIKTWHDCCIRRDTVQNAWNKRKELNRKLHK